MYRSVDDRGIRSRCVTGRANRLRRAARWWRQYQWCVVLALVVFTLVLGWIGFAKLCAKLPERWTPLDTLYLAVQLFVLNSGSMVGPKTWELEVARILAPVLSGYAAVQALAAILYEQVHSLRLRRMKNHTIICGLGRKGLLLARGLEQCGERVVVIEQDSNDPLIGQCRESGVEVITGDATDAYVLRSARVQRARRLICVCGDDTTNAEIAARARELLASEGGGPINCFVHITKPTLCHFLSEREIDACERPILRIEFFNIYDLGAQAILREHPPFERRQAQAGEPHFLVVGLGRMGQSLVVRAGLHWWWRHRGSGRKLRVTVVDRVAERKVESLILRNPRLADACEVVPLKLEIESPDFERGAFLFDEHGNCIVDAIYVCLDDSSLGLTTGLMMLNVTRGHQVPVVVRMTDDSGLASLLRGAEALKGGFENLHTFGLLDRTCGPHLLLWGTHEALARAIHEEYVRSREEAGDSPRTNKSMVSWDELPEDRKESCRAQADHIGEKLRAIRCYAVPLADWDADGFEFTSDEVEKLAQLEHERWVSEMRSRGYVYAPSERNDKRKTHPALVSWYQLPEDLRETNRRQVLRIPWLLAQVGLEIRRLNKV